MRRFLAPLAAALTMLCVSGGIGAQEEPRRYASIAAGKARMRTGPARTYPASWLYQRADLPVLVVRSVKEWRRVRDADGAEGWMLANLLSNRRTALVRGDRPAPMLEQPRDGARVAWRAAPGVVGRVSECGGGWCRFDVRGRAGYVRLGDQFWGVEAGETLP